MWPEYEIFNQPLKNFHKNESFSISKLIRIVKIIKKIKFSPDWNFLTN